MNDAPPTPNAAPEASPPEASGEGASGGTLKKALAGAIALLALGAGGWALWSYGPETVGGPKRVDVGGGEIARLDTVALARRIVTASVTGRVAEVAAGDREVLLVDPSGEITVRLEDGHEVREGATLLAVGRVREAGAASGRSVDGATPRRLDARAWSTVVAVPMPSLAGPDPVRAGPDSVRAEADSARFGLGPDRSEDAMNRSRQGR